jgi:hypothetical protein
LLGKKQRKPGEDIQVSGEHSIRRKACRRKQPQQLYLDIPRAITLDSTNYRNLLQSNRNDEYQHGEVIDDSLKDVVEV